MSVPIVDTTTNAFAEAKTASTTRNKFKKKKTKYLVIKGIKISARFAPAIAATAVIPGLGEIALTTAGVIIIGGLAIKAGSVLYKKCVQLFKAHRSNKRKSTKQRHEHGQKRRNKKEKKKTKKGWKNYK